MSSRLFQQLREDRGLAYSIYSSVQPWSDAGLLSVYAATARRESAAASQLIEEVLAQAVDTIEEREVRRVATQAKAGLLMSLESPWGQAHYLARQLQIHGRVVPVPEVIERLQAVTVDEVRAAGAKMLSGPRARATIGIPAVRAA
jgi:predicted Zn-dependent peptidase